MNNFIKSLIIAFFCLIITASTLNIAVYAQSTMKSNIEQAISSSVLGKSAMVSVSVRKADSGQLVYDRYGNLLLHTASCLKALSTAIVLEILGINENISTSIYKSNANGNLYVKLSGDPTLKSEDLINLFKTAKEKGILKIDGDIIIDSSAIDDIQWGVGWMWDDENNPLMPKVSVFNLDQNVVKVKAIPSQLNSKPTIFVIFEYPVKIINEAVTSDQDSLIIERKPSLDPEAIFISGKINTTITKSIPLGSPENYFKSRLLYAVRANGITFNQKIINGEIPANTDLLASCDHSILDILSLTNQVSNNLAAETLFKIASGKYFKNTGSTKEGFKAFSNYYKSWGADPSGQEIVDASGASHNDLLNANWISLALSKIYKRPWFKQYLNTLAQPGVRGTLKDRCPNLKGKIWAKTGTLSGVSGITGYLQSKAGNLYIFTVLIQNYKGESSQAKLLEDKIINIINNF